MRIHVNAVTDGPDLTGEVLIQIERGVATIYPEKVTFQIGHRSAEELFGKLGPELKLIKAALSQEVGE